MPLALGRADYLCRYLFMGKWQANRAKIIFISLGYVEMTCTTGYHQLHSNFFTGARMLVLPLRFAMKGSVLGLLQGRCLCLPAMKISMYVCIGPTGVVF